MKYAIPKKRNLPTLLTTICLLACLALSGQTAIDFTDPNTATYGTNAQKNENGVMTMWAGDANGDGYVLGRVKVISLFPYKEIASDRSEIQRILGGDSTKELNLYHNGDINMDGYVLGRVKVLSLFPYQEIPSDKSEISRVLGGDTSNEIVIQF